MAQANIDMSGIGGLLDIISSLAGKDKVTGGLAIDPQTNKVLVQPHKGSSGFLGIPSRNRASNLNDALLSRIYLQQMDNDARIETGNIQAKSELLSQLLRNMSAEDVAKLQIKGNLKGIGKQGTQDRKLATLNSSLTQKQDNNRSKNTIAENSQKLLAEMLTKMGIPPEAHEQYVKQILPIILKNQELQGRLETGYLESGDAREAYNLGRIGSDTAPHFKNLNTGTINLNKDSAAYVPDKFGRLSESVTGPMTQSQTYRSGGFQNPKTGEWLGQETKVMDQVVPGGIVPLKPSTDVKQRAAMMQSRSIMDGLNTGTITAPSVSFGGGNSSSGQMTNPLSTGSVKSNQPNKLTQILQYLSAYEKLMKDPQMLTYDRLTNDF